MTTVKKPSQHRLGFLSLPAEIRVNILHSLLTQSDPIGTTHKVLANRVVFEYCASLFPEILTTCKTLQMEGLPILWGQNAFLIESPGDVKLLKQTLPNQSSDKYLIKHLVVGNIGAFNITRVKELKSLRMLESITIRSCRWSTYASPRRQSLSISALQADLEDKFRTVDSKGLLAFLHDRPQVKFVLQKVIEQSTEVRVEPFSV